MVGDADAQGAIFKHKVRAYQKVRPDGELHIPAVMAAVDAYKRHEGEAEDASRQIQDYIAFAASLDPEEVLGGCPA